jgi:hypothetical protein
MRSGCLTAKLNYSSPREEGLAVLLRPECGKKGSVCESRHLPQPEFVSSESLPTISIFFASAVELSGGRGFD